MLKWVIKETIDEQPYSWMCTICGITVELTHLYDNEYAVKIQSQNSQNAPFNISRTYKIIASSEQDAKQQAVQHILTETNSIREKLDRISQKAKVYLKNPNPEHKTNAGEINFNNLDNTARFDAILIKTVKADSQPLRIATIIKQTTQKELFAPYRTVPYKINTQNQKTVVKTTEGIPIEIEFYELLPCEESVEIYVRDALGNIRLPKKLKNAIITARTKPIF